MGQVSSYPTPHAGLPGRRTRAPATPRAHSHGLGLANLGFLAPGEPVAPALNGGGELREVHLERVEDVVGVVLGAEPDLPLARARLLDDLLGLALGLLDDLLRRDEPGLLLARLLEDALGLALGLGQHLLALLDDPTRLLDLLRDRRAHLVEDVVDLLLVDAHLVGEGHRLGVVYLVVELVDEDEYVHSTPQFVSAGALPLTARSHVQAPSLTGRRRTSQAPSRRSS